jgi:hypothetical protein
MLHPSLGVQQGGAVPDHSRTTRSAGPAIGGERRISLSCRSTYHSRRSGRFRRSRSGRYGTAYPPAGALYAFELVLGIGRMRSWRRQERNADRPPADAI